MNAPEAVDKFEEFHKDGEVEGRVTAAARRIVEVLFALGYEPPLRPRIIDELKRRRDE